MTKHWRKFQGTKLAQSGTKSEAVRARFVHVEVRRIVSAISHRRIFETLARLRHRTPERLLVHALRARRRSLTCATVAGHTTNE
jgi:predicted nucleotidyltransferase